MKYTPLLVIAVLFASSVSAYGGGGASVIPFPNPFGREVSRVNNDGEHYDLEVLSFREGVPHRWEGENDALLVDSIIVESRNAEGVTLFITKGKEKPFGLEGRTYDWFTIKTSFDGELRRATILFKVENSWMKKNDLNSIYISKDGKTQKPQKVGEDKSHSSFALDVSSFSDFVVFGRKETTTPVFERKETPVKPPIVES